MLYTEGANTILKRGRRFDHVFAAPSLLKNADCFYLYFVREQGLSDHSALVFDFEGPLPRELI